MPANASGAWKLAGSDFLIEQKFQKFKGSLGGVPVEEGRLHGDEISFIVGGVQYYGSVNGSEMRGLRPKAWRATKVGG